MIAKVAVSAAVYSIDRLYDYLIPEELEHRIKPGTRVYVPFSAGNRHCFGVVLAVEEKSEYSKLKSIAQCLDDEPVMDELQLKLALFIRNRFFSTFFDAVRVILPSGLWFNDKNRRRIQDKYTRMAKLSVDTESAADYADRIRRRSPKQAELLDMLCSFMILPLNELLLHCDAGMPSFKALEKAGYAETEERELLRMPIDYPDEQKPLPVLNAEQESVFRGIRAQLGCGAGVSLLQGVTGSGKTSVYINLISETLSMGKSALLLVPEIALTPQMINTFAAHFGRSVAVLHSALQMSERYDEWKRIRRGEARVVIGTRSAVFAPLQEPGLIIIDEFHDDSYISESSPRYSTVDIAKFICVKTGARLLLGSATPDIVTRYNAEQGKYSMFRLESRYNGASMPHYELVDMKQELKNGNGSALSRRLVEEIRKNIENGEQSLVFINRRGSNKLVFCPECGYSYECPNCSVHMTYHRSNNRLICHRCGASRRMDRACPECGGALMFAGSGTQQIEDELKKEIPGIDVIRVDTDTVNTAGGHEVLFERFRNERVPVMVGTQMLVKGHNFDNITLVGIVDADQGLFSSDYRASEKCFVTLMQVIGRSGRAAIPGRAVIQTYTPLNRTIELGARQDYDTFYAEELELRKLQNAPPFCDYFSLIAYSESDNDCICALNYAREYILHFSDGLEITGVLGPAPMSVGRVNNKFRYSITVAGRNTDRVRNLISQALIATAGDKRFKNTSVIASAVSID